MKFFVINDNFEKLIKVTFTIQQVKLVSFTIYIFYNYIFEKALFRVIAILR